MVINTKFKAGDKVRILDGSNIENYCCGWSVGMSKDVGTTHTVKEVLGPHAVTLAGSIYTWDVRGLELVEEEKVENKIILNGVEYTLSAELAEKLMAEVTEQKVQRDLKSPLEREEYDTYYYITPFGHVSIDTDDKLRTDDDKYNVANYCRDKGLMEQRALHETLNRMLWRYSEMHGGDNPWDGSNHHYYIYRISDSGGLCVTYSDAFHTEGVVYFKEERIAINAIIEVVEPFMAEHPEFVW